MKTQNFLPLFAAALAGSLATAVVSLANSVQYSASFGPTAFNYSTSFTFPKFDTTLGTLNSIVFNLQGVETAVQKVESLDGAASVITATTSGSMTLFRPDNSLLVVTAPTVVNAFSATAFDNGIDFGGTSGASFTTTSATTSNFATYTGGADLALFSVAGVGTIALPVTATGNAQATGAGNMITSFNTSGSTTAFVTYNFTVAAAVPETSTYGSIGAVALVGLLGYRRSRTSAAKSE